MTEDDIRRIVAEEVARAFRRPMYVHANGRVMYDPGGTSLAAASFRTEPTLPATIAGACSLLRARIGAIELEVESSQRRSEHVDESLVIRWLTEALDALPVLSARDEVTR